MTIPMEATDAEMQAYEVREARSPEAGEFKGGDCGIVAAVFLVAVVVVLILFLKKEGQI